MLCTRVALAAFALLLGLSPARAQEPVVLEGARLIDGTGRPPLENSALVIEGGFIRAVGKAGAMRYPEGARVVDVRGKTLIPALINLHGHVGLTRGLEQDSEKHYTEENVRAQLEQYLAYGVAAVAALGTDQELGYKIRDAQSAGRLGGARLYTAGLGFGAPEGYPPSIARPRDVHRPKTAAETRAQVRELAARRPDFVKIWLDDGFGKYPRMKPEIYQAIIDEAHKQGLRVVAHVFYRDDALSLVEAGVDGLVHSVRDRAADDVLIDALKAHRVFLVPTLTRDESTFIYAESPAWLDDPFFKAGVTVDVLAALRSSAFVSRARSDPDLPKLKAGFEMAKRNLKRMADAGVRIAMGTDSGPPARFQGYFEHRELELMVESGLTPMQALVSATRTAAEILAETVAPPATAAGEKKPPARPRPPDFGTLAPGKRADFLVLDANPLQDIRNTRKLSAVWQSGRPVRTITVSASRGGSAAR
jgi:imidazolonepropionase-like amidohydrolase